MITPNRTLLVALGWIAPAITIELTGSELAPLGQPDLRKVHILDSTGKEVLCQPVVTDYNELRKPSEVIFQANFAPGETKTFTVTSGKKQVYVKDDFKAYGRFVPHRSHSLGKIGRLN